jgi:hypothetical protein
MKESGIPEREELNMKTAILWGTIFGILQAIISLVAGLNFSSPNVSPQWAAIACVGLLLSFILTLLCSLIGTIHAKDFGIGFWAGIISTGFDILTSLIVYVINPRLLEVGVLAAVISFAISIGFGIVFSAVGAGIGLFIDRQFIRPAQTQA